MSWDSNSRWRNTSSSRSTERSRSRSTSFRLIISRQKRSTCSSIQRSHSQKRSRAKFSRRIKYAATQRRPLGVMLTSSQRQSQTMTKTACWSKFNPTSQELRLPVSCFFTYLESFGIRDFYIYTGNCVESCVSCTASGACQTIYTLQKSMYTEPIFINDYLWQIFDIIPLPIQTCSGKSILGGPGQFITPLHKVYRIVDIAATHTYIRIQMTIYLLDNWLNEIVTVTVDEKEVFKQMFHQNSFPSTLCGDGAFKDMTFELDEYVQHTSNRVKVEVTTNIDSTATTSNSLVKNRILGNQGLRTAVYVIIYYDSIIRC